MDSEKIKTFMRLAGQEISEKLSHGDPEQRKLGARLLLSEVLEYVIDGLGVIPEFNGQRITDSEGVNYLISESKPDSLAMLDGLADTAYTMYWNACAFGLPLEQGFELVCDNNLQKFVRLANWEGSSGPLERERWDCGCGVSWPNSVTRVEVIQLGENFYAVGKDSLGKVRKPSTYVPVDLTPLAKMN